jgi:serine/threonine-protein kinase
VRTSLTEPNTPIEHQYVATSRRSAELTTKKDDLGVIRVWQDFARQLHPDDKDERGWYLLTQKRLTETGRAIENREKFVRTEVERAQAKFNAGSFEEASAIRRNLRDEYGAYTSLETVLPPELKPSDSEDSDKKPGGADNKNEPKAKDEKNP